MAAESEVERLRWENEYYKKILMEIWEEVNDGDNKSIKYMYELCKDALGNK